MSEELLNSIDQKLSKIIYLLALNTIKDKSSEQTIEFLNNLGLNSTEIGKITNKTPVNVRMQLSRLKRKKKRGKNNE